MHKPGSEDPHRRERKFNLKKGCKVQNLNLKFYTTAYIRLSWALTTIYTLIVLFIPDHFTLLISESLASFILINLYQCQLCAR